MASTSLVNSLKKQNADYTIGQSAISDLTGLTNIGEKNAAYSNASDTLKGILGENSAAYDSILRKDLPLLPANLFRRRIV